MAHAKYGYTTCALFGTAINVRPLTAAQTQRAGYDAETNGEYLAGRCDVCAGYKTVVYCDDVMSEPVSDPSVRGSHAA